MNYMWEALLAGVGQGLSPSEIRFAPAGLANPYREIFFKDINRPEIFGDEIEVNPYYRFGAIFGALLGEKMAAHGALTHALFNLLAHFLTEQDLQQGMHRDAYYAQFLLEDLQNGRFGAKSAQGIALFSKEQLRYILSALLRLYRVGASMRLLAGLVRELWPGSIVYLDTGRRRRELLMYIGLKKTARLEAQVDLICDLFVPADYEITLFWDKHFGLIGVSETMGIGQFMMY